MGTDSRIILQERKDELIRSRVEYFFNLAKVPKADSDAAAIRLYESGEMHMITKAARALPGTTARELLIVDAHSMEIVYLHKKGYGDVKTMLDEMTKGIGKVMLNKQG